MEWRELSDENRLIRFPVINWRHARFCLINDTISQEEDKPFSAALRLTDFWDGFVQRFAIPGKSILKFLSISVLRQAGIARKQWFSQSQQVPLQVIFFRWRHLALDLMVLPFWNSFVSNPRNIYRKRRILIRQSLTRYKKVEISDLETYT